MKKMSKIVKVFVVAALWTGFTCLNAFAASNTLSAVEIKDSENGYQIILRSDNSAEVRKTVDSRDDITLEVKGLVPLDSVGTVYNNVPDVDSVIIQPEEENTKVIVHGKNIAKANILFAPVEVQDAAQPEESANSASSGNEIVLSRPIQTYSPVFNQSQSFDDESQDGSLKASASLILHKVQQSKPYAAKLFRYLKRLDRKYLVFGSIFLLIILFGFKSIKPERNDEIKIGLTQSLKEKEVDMRDELSLRDDVQTLRNQKSLSNKTVPSINYGIKSYQNSQKNPYTSQISGLPMKNTAKPHVRAQGLQARNNMSQNQAELQAKLNQVKQMQVRKPVTAPEALNTVKPKTPSLNGSKSIDSMKFLESMTKIYERSGRADLANELKSNIQKAQMVR